MKRDMKNTFPLALAVAGADFVVFDKQILFGSPLANYQRSRERIDSSIHVEYF